MPKVDIKMKEEKKNFLRLRNLQDQVRLPPNVLCALHAQASAASVVAQEGEGLRAVADVEGDRSHARKVQRLSCNPG